MQVGDHLVQNGLHLPLRFSAVGDAEQFERSLLEVFVLGEPEDVGQGGAHVQTEVGGVLPGRSRLRLDTHLLAVRRGAQIRILGLVHAYSWKADSRLVLFPEAHLDFPPLHLLHNFALFFYRIIEIYVCMHIFGSLSEINSLID